MQKEYLPRKILFRLSRFQYTSLLLLIFLRSFLLKKKIFFTQHNPFAFRIRLKAPRADMINL